MNIWHIKYFIEAAKLQSLDLAAKALHVTPSAISQGIRALEDSTGLELITHQKRLFILTEEGRKFASMSADIIARLDSMPDEIKADLKEWKGPLNFIAPSSLFVGRLWDAVCELQKKKPDLKVNFKVGVAAVIRQLVKEEKVDFGIIIDDEELAEFQSRTLFSGEFHLVGRSPNLKPEKTGIVVTEKRKVEVEHLTRELKKMRIHNVNYLMELQSWTLIKKWCLKFDVVGYLPDYVVEDEIAKKKLFRLSLGEKPFQYSTKFIWPKQRPEPRGITALTELL